MPVTYTEFTCRSGGSNLYAGSLNGTGETSTTPLITYTTGSWNAPSSFFTPAGGANPLSDGVQVGMYAAVYLDGTTGSTPAVGRITNVTSTVISFSTTSSIGSFPATNSNTTLVVGGAWQGPVSDSNFPLNFINGNLQANASNRPIRVNIKNDQSYARTVGLTWGAINCVFEGYTSTPGDGGVASINGPSTGTAFTLVTLSGSGNFIKNIDFYDNGDSGSADLVSVTGARNTFDSCQFYNSRQRGLSASSRVFCYRCIMRNNTGGGFIQATNTSPSYLFACVIRDNSGATSDGVLTANPSNLGLILDSCIIRNNGRHGINFNDANNLFIAKNCIIHQNGGSGITAIQSNSGLVHIINNLITNNGAWGISCASLQANKTLMYNNAFYNNTSGEFNQGSAVSGQWHIDFDNVTLTADPYVNEAGDDYSLNNTAGGGAACRAAGIPSTFLEGSMIGYLDIGPLQHQDSGGGGGSVAIPVSGRICS